LQVRLKPEGDYYRECIDHIITNLKRHTFHAKFGNAFIKLSMLRHLKDDDKKWAITMSATIKGRPASLTFADKLIVENTPKATVKYAMSILMGWIRQATLNAPEFVDIIYSDMLGMIANKHAHTIIDSARATVRQLCGIQQMLGKVADCKER